MCKLSLRVLCLCGLLSLLAVATGCGRSRGSVSGTVTYQGKALPGGYVNFTSEGETPTVKSSAIGSDGRYAVSGVPVGHVKITVQGIIAPLQPSQGKAPGEEVPRSGPKQTVYVPPDYGTLERSPLEFEVHGGSQTHDIELK